MLKRINAEAQKRTNAKTQKRKNRKTQMFVVYRNLFHISFFVFRYVSMFPRASSIKYFTAVIYYFL
jgi:hypothetical protein